MTQPNASPIWNRNLQEFLSCKSCSSCQNVCFLVAAGRAVPPTTPGWRTTSNGKMTLLQASRIYYLYDDQHYRENSSWQRDFASGFGHPGLHGS